MMSVESHINLYVGRDVVGSSSKGKLYECVTKPHSTLVQTEKERGLALFFGPPASRSTLTTGHAVRETNELSNV